MSSPCQALTASEAAALGYTPPAGWRVLGNDEPGRYGDAVTYPTNKDYVEAMLDKSCRVVFIRQVTEAT